MGSASRPQRRGRPSRVSYRESCSEDEGKDFHGDDASPSSKASEGKDGTRRNLALKRVSRSQERAETLQIQKAIEESLSQEKAGITSLDVVADSKAADDSEEEASDAQCINHKEEDKKSPCREEGPQKQQKSSRAAKENDEDWADGDDDDADDNDDGETGTEDEDSDLSEDFTRKRKGPSKSRQKGKQAAVNRGKEQKTLAASVKKPRSSRGVPEAGTQFTVKKKQSNGIKPLAHAQLACRKTATNYPSPLETSRKHVAPDKENTNSHLQGVPFKACKSALDGTALNVHGNAATFDSTLFDGSAQSPTGLHRRVIGLSRRFKPPPLHPYLPRAES